MNLKPVLHDEFFSLWGRFKVQDLHLASQLFKFSSWTYQTVSQFLNHLWTVINHLFKLFNLLHLHSQGLFKCSQVSRLFVVFSWTLFRTSKQILYLLYFTHLTNYHDPLFLELKKGHLLFQLFDFLTRRWLVQQLLVHLRFLFLQFLVKLAYLVLKHFILEIIMLQVVNLTIYFIQLLVLFHQKFLQLYWRLWINALWTPLL